MSGLRKEMRGKINHFQTVCRKQSVHQIQMHEEYTSDSEESIFKVELLGAVQSGYKALTVPLIFDADPGEIDVQCQIDIGATCNVMSIDTLCEIKQTGAPQIRKSAAKLKLYDDSIIDVLGECDLRCHYKGVRHQLNFKIVDAKQPQLLSSQTCTCNDEADQHSC